MLIFEFSPHQIALFVSATFFYILGAGIAKYLGKFQNIQDFWYGLIFIILLYACSFLFQHYFDPKQLKIANQSEEGLIKSRQNLLAGLALFMTCSVIAYLLIVFSRIDVIAIVFTVFIFLVAFLYAIPPFRLAERGYGDLVLIPSISLINPALAFTIQSGELHSLLLLISVPLFFFLMAMFVSTGLTDYLHAMLGGEKNLVIMLGWKLAMVLHDWFVILGYALIGLAFFQGLPWKIIWPTLVPLPVFIFTMYEIHKIRDGNKPRWLILTFSGYTGAGLMLYGLLFTLWFG